MSAYVVDSEHINVMVYYAMESHGATSAMFYSIGPADINVAYDLTPESGLEVYYGELVRRVTQRSANAVGQMLLSANYASVNARYDEDDLGVIYRYKRPRSIDWEPVEVLSAIQCYKYQACEVDNWTETEAYKFCVALEGKMIRQLPDYGEAPWEITRETETLYELRRREARERRQ